MTGDKCCDDMRCCYEDAQESPVTVIPEIEDPGDDLIKGAIDVMENHSEEHHVEDHTEGITEKDPGDLIKDAIDVMENHSFEHDAEEHVTEVNDVIKVEEHDAGDDSNDDNDIPELTTEQDAGDDYQYGFGDLIESDEKDNDNDDLSEKAKDDDDSSEKDNEDDSDEGKQSLEIDDNDPEDDSNELPEINDDDDDSEEVEKTSKATESPAIDLIQGQVVASDTHVKDDEQVNQEIIIVDHTEAGVSDDTKEGNQEENKEDDVNHNEEAYEDEHDNQEASKDESIILDNNTVWEEEITEKTSESTLEETTLKVEETTTVDAKEDDSLGNVDLSKETISSIPTYPPIVEEEFEKENKETIEFIAIEINELETNENMISEKFSEKKDTEEISLTINPIRKQIQVVSSGRSTYSKTSFVSMMGILYVIRFLS